MISPKKQKKKKSMTSTNKYEVEGSFNSKTLKNNILHHLFYSNISEFAGNLQEIINEGT